MKLWERKNINRMAYGITMLTSNFRNVFHERDYSNLCKGLLWLVNMKHMTVLHKEALVKLTPRKGMMFLLYLEAFNSKKERIQH